jgi:hypothetical protein
LTRPDLRFDFKPLKLDTVLIEWLLQQFENLVNRDFLAAFPGRAAARPSFCTNPRLLVAFTVEPIDTLHGSKSREPEYVGWSRNVAH